MVQQLIADKMNNTSFIPTSCFLLEPHSAFGEPRDLSKECCMINTITANQVKEKQANMRVQLIKMVSNFEINGDSDGNMVDKDKEWETQKQCTPTLDKLIKPSCTLMIIIVVSLVTTSN